MPSTEPTCVTRVISAALAMPKSASLALPSRVTIRLAGLTSRWITPARCAHSSASQASAAIETARAGLELAAAAEHLRERCALDVLHDDEVLVAGGVVDARVEDLDDVRVLEPRDGQRLVAEARDEVLVARRGASASIFSATVRLSTVSSAITHDGHAAAADLLDLAVAPGDQRLAGVCGGLGLVAHSGSRRRSLPGSGCRAVVGVSGALLPGPVRSGLPVAARASAPAAGRLDGAGRLGVRRSRR